MKTKSDCKIAALVLAAVIACLLLSACGPKTPEQTGQIYLYGEIHNCEIIYEKEFELWSEYYHERGLRHLFIEWPYFTAEFTNLWMQSDNDDILFWAFGEPEAQDPAWKFLKEIKAECPETVFHGTDVGDGYDTFGPRYLEYLESIGQKDSEQYRLAQENMEQGRLAYGDENGAYQEDGKDWDWAYREDKMAENFAREMDSLGQVDVMGIYGTAHVKPGLKDTTGKVPNMTTQLQEQYGERVHTELVADLITEGYRTDTIEMGGKEYAAQYFGKIIMYGEPDCDYMEYWRLEDAFEDVKDMRSLYSYLAYDRFPLKVEDGQVFLVENTLSDGSQNRWFYRADGLAMGGELVAECFDPYR